MARLERGAKWGDWKSNVGRLDDQCIHVIIMDILFRLNMVCKGVGSIFVLFEIELLFVLWFIF